MIANVKNVLINYGYPDIVIDIISRFEETVLNVLGGEKVGILLVGSASRGELCWGVLDEGIVLYSDIEFIIVADGVSNDSKKILSQKIQKLTSLYDLGKRFHFDYVINNWSSLQYLEKKIFVFDCKNTGLDLTNYRVKEKLPEVNKSNLDFKELNDVLLHRMKAVINDIPDDIFDNDKYHRDFVLSIAKNALDITTWLYPYEANVLISGFECRLNSWDKKQAGMLLADYFDVNDFLFLRECLNIRRMPLGSYNGIVLLNNFVTTYEKAIDYCKAMNSIDSDAAIDANATSKKLFDEFKIRRRLAEMYQIISHYKLFSFSNMISNILFPRKGKQVKFCLIMIKAVVENASRCEINSTFRGCEYIGIAREELSDLRKVQEKYTGNFSDDWKALRREYLMLNKIFI